MPDAASTPTVVVVGLGPGGDEGGRGREAETPTRAGDRGILENRSTREMFAGHAGYVPAKIALAKGWPVRLELDTSQVHSLALYL